MPEQVFLPAGPTSGRLTPASFPFYTSGEDNLRVTSYNSAAGVALKINGRLLDSSGKANADSWDHAPNTDRTAKTSDIPLSGSTLLNICVFASAGAPLLGQTFVIVQLIRGLGAGALVLGTILQGYVTGPLAIGWPGSPLQNTADIAGYTRTIAGTTPAAGAEISEIVPAGAIWELTALNFTLLTGGAGAARTVRLVATVAAAIAISAPPAVAQNVATTFTYAWANNLMSQSIAYGAGSLVTAPIPQGVLLPAGATIGTSTANLAAPDQFSSVSYNVRERLLS